MFEKASGHFYKHWIMTLKSPAEMAWILVYPFVGLISIGLFASFLIGSGAPLESLIFVFAGVMIWNFYDLSQHAITYGITYEIWSDSLKHFFSTTSTNNDYILGNSMYGLFISSSSLVIVGTIGFIIFGFNIFSAGIYLVLGSLSVFLFASSIGLIINYFMITKNVKYMSLIWMSTGIIMIFSGVYYPVSVLPGFAQSIAYMLPSTHAIEGIRLALMNDFTGANLSIYSSFVLSVIFFVLGYFAFKRGVDKGRELGKIARY